MGLLVCPIITSPLAKLKRYKETTARLKKIRDAGYKVVSICSFEFTKLLRENPGLENELCSHAFVRTFQLIL